MKKLSAIALIQGVYYFLTGLWALVHIESFIMITGPKEDIWLVKMVGALIVVISLVLLMSGYRRKVSPEIILLAIASATAFIFIDVYYVAIGRIARVYLLDALAELILILMWTAALLKVRRSYSIPKPE